MHLLTIISGGQTGADRAALDFAIARGIEHGGWCSAGRRAEDGPLDAKYQLAETESARYRVRTVRNVRDGDATLILNLGELEGGSRETQRIAERQGKSVRVVQVDAPTTDAELHELREWLRVNAVARLNVAGPRESKRPGVYQAALSLLERLFPTAE
jgi:hypothetical protein